MKTLQVLFAALLLSSFTISANASNTETKTLNSNEFSAYVQKEIGNTVQYPKTALKENIEGFVVVEYKVDANGQITVLNSDASNNELENYVKSVLENKTLQYTPATEQIMYAKFRFMIK